MSSSKILAFLISCFFGIVVMNFAAPDLMKLTDKIEKIKLNKIFQGNSTPLASKGRGSNNKKKSKTKSSSKKRNLDVPHVAKTVDNYKGVDVFFNGATSNVFGRNVTNDGYNLGLRYQCVEFVKRFYYEVYSHRMPNSYGHAKEFYNHSVSDGNINRDRGLVQYKNGSFKKPAKDALLIFGPTRYNQFGHVAIISEIGSHYVEIVQQNAGPTAQTRGTYPLRQRSGKWYIDSPEILGWLHTN